MASGNYRTPPYYPFDTQFPLQPIYTVTAGNDIGRLENQMAMVLEPTRVKKKRSLCLTIVTVISVIFNLILAAGIAWCLYSHYGDREKVMDSNVRPSDGYSSGAVVALKLKTQGSPCEILTSSAICMPCQGLHSGLLWREVLIKVRAGKTDLCCRKLEDSMKRLVKEIRDVHQMTKSNRKGAPNGAALSQFYYVHNDHIGVDLGRVPLKHPEQSPYSTNLKVKESGAYKIFAAIAMSANGSTCVPSERYFIRVVAEHPDHSSTYLLRRDWKCPKGLSDKSAYLHPVGMEETFYLSKDTILYVEVFNRLQIYPFEQNSYVGLIKI